jgi:hypothetical protein
MARTGQMLSQFEQPVQADTSWRTLGRKPNREVTPETRLWKDPAGQRKRHQPRPPTVKRPSTTIQTASVMMLVVPM